MPAAIATETRVQVNIAEELERIYGPTVFRTLPIRTGLNLDEPFEMKVILPSIESLVPAASSRRVPIR